MTGNPRGTPHFCRHLGMGSEQPRPREHTFSAFSGHRLAGLSPVAEEETGPGTPSLLAPTVSSGTEVRPLHQSRRWSWIPPPLSSSCPTTPRHSFYQGPGAACSLQGAWTSNSHRQGPRPRSLSGAGPHLPAAELSGQVWGGRGTVFGESKSLLARGLPPPATTRPSLSRR